MQDITQLKKRLWEAADQLRANSKLTQTEYSMPVPGLIFLRYAYSRFLLVTEEIKENLPTLGGKTRAITKEDYKGKAALYLPGKSRYDFLINLPQGSNPALAVTATTEVPPGESAAGLKEAVKSYSKVISGFRKAAAGLKTVLVQKIKIKLIIPICRLNRYEQNN